MRAAIEQLLRPSLQRCFGYHLLGLGPFARQLCVGDCPARYHWSLAAAGADIQSAPEQLPILSDSVDTVVLPFTLDVCAQPHAVLREVQRVLIGDGQVFIIGANPWSLWGLARKRRLHLQRRLSAQRVIDWLQLLDFEVAPVQYTWYRPPLRSLIWQQRWQFIDRLGAKFWTRGGAVYVLSAQKRVVPMTPIRLPARSKILRFPVPGRVVPAPRLARIGQQTDAADDAAI